MVEIENINNSFNLVKDLNNETEYQGSYNYVHIKKTSGQMKMYSF